MAASLHQPLNSSLLPQDQFQFSKSNCPFSLLTQTFTNIVSFDKTAPLPVLTTTYSDFKFNLVPRSSEKLISLISLVHVGFSLIFHQTTLVLTSLRMSYFNSQEAIRENIISILFTAMGNSAQCPHGARNSTCPYQPDQKGL